MGEYVNVIRLPLAIPEDRESIDITEGLFSPGSNHSRSLIMFGADPSDRRPDRMFYTFKGIPTVLVNPELPTPLSEERALESVDKILKVLSGRGASFFSIVNVEDLSGPRKHSQIGISAFKSQIERAFSRETVIRGVPAFRVGGPITPDQIMAGQFPDTEPLVLGDLDVFRDGWNRAGITQIIAH